MAGGQVSILSSLGGIIIQSTPFDASSGLFPAGSLRGYRYYCSIAGTIDGVSFAIGDSITALVDGASTVSYLGNWVKEQDGDLTGGSGVAPSKGIIDWASLPDTSSNVFIEPLSVKSVNKLWRRHVVVFRNSGTKIGFHGGFLIPNDYGSDLSVDVHWCSHSLSGNVVWLLEYRAVALFESLDQATIQGSSGGASSSSGSPLTFRSINLALTDSDFAAGDEVEFAHYRDGLSGLDNLAEEALLLGLYLNYTAA
jgi:hypothetical protein